MRKIHLAGLGVITGLAVLASGAVWGHGKGHSIGAHEHPSIKTRHMLMDNTLFAIKTAGRMMKGEAPYDAATAELSMRTLATVAQTMEQYFSKASKPGPQSKSEASPKVWSDPKGFAAEIEKFKSVTGKAIKPAGQGMDPFKEAFISVTQSCKSCHESFRIKKEQ